MENCEVEIIGLTPLLMHIDNIDWADQMDAWAKIPENKKFMKPGDDRAPAFRWLGCLSYNDKILTIPNEWVMACLRNGGAKVLVPGGKSGKTFKAQSQSGILGKEVGWPLLVSGEAIGVSDVRTLMDVKDFAEHKKVVEQMGFSLFVKRAKIGMQKHIRVRPRFDEWSTHLSLTLLDEQITKGVLQQIFDQCGQYVGLGDWRAGGKTPGAFGMFKATVK